MVCLDPRALDFCCGQKRNRLAYTWIMLNSKACCFHCSISCCEAKSETVIYLWWIYV